MIARLKDCLSETARRRLIESLVISRLAYGIGIWGNTCPTQIAKVQVCLNMAARFVTGDKMTTRKDDLMRKCNWLDAWDMIEYYSLTLLWKATRWNSPENLNEKLGRDENGILTTDNPRLLITRQAFRANSVSKWNDLPLELRTENNIGRFKRILKTWLRERRENNHTLDPG